MRAIVDVSSLVVRYGEASWPFRLDLDRGSASIELEDRAYEVCPLTWRAKMRLARFAHMDQTFVQARFLEACLRAPKVAPTENADQAVLAALARWINLSFEETAGLPLDTGQLAAVTVDVCRALRLGPMAFAEVSAPEVEMLWASLNRETSDDLDHPTQAPEPLNSVNLSEPQFDTKIVILPDQTESEDVAPSDVPEAILPVEDSGSPAISDAPAAVVAEASNETMTMFSRQAGEHGRNPPARFRFSINKPIAKVSNKKAARSRSSIEQPNETRQFPSTGLEKLEPIDNENHFELPAPREISLDNPAISPSTSPVPSRVVATTTSTSRWPEFEQRNEPEPVSQAEDMEAIFDKFCERLAEAAEDLGILEEV